jgi:hypothetical protein
MSVAISVKNPLLSSILNNRALKWNQEQSGAANPGRIGQPGIVFLKYPGRRQIADPVKSFAYSI